MDGTCERVIGLLAHLYEFPTPNFSTFQVFFKLDYTRVISQIKKYNPFSKLISHRPQKIQKIRKIQKLEILHLK